MPHAALSTLSQNIHAPQHLAYIELFTADPHHNHGMYTVKWCLNQDGDSLAAVVPVSDLYSSVHLYPHFGPTAPCQQVSSYMIVV